MGNVFKGDKNKQNKTPEDQDKEDGSSQQIYEFNIIGKKKKQDLTNQDTNDIITKELGENIKYFAVYDGHGGKGRDASLLLKYEINKKLKKDKAKLPKMVRKEQVEKYFKDMFKSIQKKFEDRSNDYELSGSCAICILIIEYKLYCINLGDSRAVLGTKKSGKKMAIEMSIDHKPVRDDETKRINEKGGEVSDKLGVHRVFKKNEDTPGLAVSRSIGDLVAHECGVISEPEIIEHDIQPDDLFVVIGSDGIWDAISSVEVVGLIMDKMENKKEQSCRILVEECRNRWEILNIYKQRYLVEMHQSSNEKSESSNKSKDNLQQAMDIDDITGIVHFFNYDF
jgi:integrin-linked kinase-associated serine/threonine phosphatase 2C